MASEHKHLTTKDFLFPFILITSLFFLWGIAEGMVDVLNKHFQEILQMSKARSGLIQFSLYFAYFTMALPAGYFMRKFGYKKGIILGLSLFALGAFLIAGTASFQSFGIFLFCLYLLGCGLATLETGANPYTTKLGPPETAERRINLSQAFNGLAWTIGPFIGVYIYGTSGVKEGGKLGSLILPYVVIGFVVLVIAVIFMFTQLPEIEDENENLQGESKTKKSLIKQRHFVLGVIAQFAYVAAQTGVFSYLINYITDDKLTPHFDVSYGPYFLSIGFALFMIGRLSGSYLMSFFKPYKVLAFYAVMCCLMLPLVSSHLGWISIIALYLIFFFMSVMYPTIFALAIRDLKEKTKKASSFIVMSVVGGAILPLLMGWVADISSMAIGFLVPLPLFAFIVYYALYGSKIKNGLSMQQVQIEKG